MIENKQQKRRQPIFLILSLFLHGLLVVFLMLKETPPIPQAPQTVEVEYISPDDLTPPPGLEEVEANAKKKETLRDQIVEQEKQLNDEKPVDSRFLSAFNQTVQQQTRAQSHGEFNNTAKGGQPDEGVKDGDKEQEQMEKERQEADEHQVTEREPGDLPELKDLIPKYGLSPGPKAPKLDENGNPSQTDDHLKDVNTGMQTLLSTREFVYYAYYNRIKDSLRQHWEPNVRQKVKIIYRQGRTIASAKDRVTQVMVTLNPNGDLVKIEVLTQSGVVDLDSAAVEAFREAAPFPNPPKGMVEADGTIKIRWDFVLEA